MIELPYKIYLEINGRRLPIEGIADIDRSQERLDRLKAWLAAAPDLLDGETQDETSKTEAEEPNDQAPEESESKNTGLEQIFAELPEVAGVAEEHPATADKEEHSTAENEAEVLVLIDGFDSPQSGLRGALKFNPPPGQRSIDVYRRSVGLIGPDVPFSVKDLIPVMEQEGWLSESTYKPSIVRNFLREDERIKRFGPGLWVLVPSAENSNSAEQSSESGQNASTPAASESPMWHLASDFLSGKANQE